MELEMNNRQAGLDEEDSRRAERLLRFVMGRFTGTVSRLRVTFFDVNGPKGGYDKRCRITAKMKVAGQVVAQNGGHSYCEALSLCLDKLARAIRRNVDRRRTGPIRKSRMPTLYHAENLNPVRPEMEG